MRFVPDENAAAWLRDFVPESIFLQEKFLFAGRIIDPSHAEWRGLILGRGESGRNLALIFTRRLERLRPISCRTMRPDERRLYEASIQEHS
jgi:uncharacterized DUF497 family protein